MRIRRRFMLWMGPLALLAGCGGGGETAGDGGESAVASRRSTRVEGELPDPFAGTESAHVVGSLTPDQLVDALGDDDTSRRTAAHDRLLAVGEGARQSLIEKGLPHHNPRARANAAEVLGRMGSPGGRHEVLDALVKCLDESVDSPFARQMALWALGRLRILDDADAVDKVGKKAFFYLDSPHPEIRSHAAQTLRLVRYRDSVPRLITLLDPATQGAPEDLIYRNYILDALKDITLENYGLDAQKWSQWWARVQHDDRLIFGS